MSKVSEEKGEMAAAIARNLTAFADEAELSYRDLARYGKTSLKSAYNLCYAEHAPKTSTLEALCNALRISPAALIHRGTLDLSLLASKRPERAIEALARMSPERQKQAVEILEEMAKSPRSTPVLNEE